jgi:hypothetical protein
MRALDGAVFFATCGVVGLFIILLTVRGAEYFEANILPWLLEMSVVLCLGVVAAGALFFLGKARPALPIYLSPASILLGFAAWSYAFTLTAHFAGPAWLAIGFGFGGITLLPVGFVAALLAGEFAAAAITAALFLAALAARALSERCVGGRIGGESNS